MPVNSPIRTGKRVNIKRQTYAEMMTLNKVNETDYAYKNDSRGNFARAFAVMEKLPQT